MWQVVQQHARDRTAKKGDAHVHQIFDVEFALLLLAASAILLGTLPASRSALATADSDGVVKVESVYGFDETITRLEADIEKRGSSFSSRSINRNSVLTPGLS